MHTKLSDTDWLLAATGFLFGALSLLFAVAVLAVR
jgi:hypothetical protein